MMHINTLFSLTLLAVALLAIEVFATPSNYSASHVAVDSSNHGDPTYTSRDGEVLHWGRMEFNGTIHGIPITDSGSFNELYEKYDMSHLLATTEASVDDVDETESGVLPRAALQKADCNCWPVPHQPDWEEGYLANAKEIVSRVNNWKGTCRIGARHCYQVTCVGATAFSACNDNYHDIYPECSYFATFAQDLIDKCTRKVGWFLPTYRVGDQEFETEGYNLFITKEKWGCSGR